jgi:hypothetical protein
MAVPMIKATPIKTVVIEERRARTHQNVEVQSAVKNILQRRLKEHAPTWAKLAKR